MDTKFLQRVFRRAEARNGGMTTFVILTKTQARRKGRMKFLRSP